MKKRLIFSNVLCCLGLTFSFGQEANLVFESQPAIVDVGSSGATLMPRVVGGMIVLEHRAGPTEPAYSIYSLDGRLAARFRIDIPEALETIDSRLVPLRGGAGFVAIAIAVKGLNRVANLCFVDSGGKLGSVVQASPYFPTHLTVASDGTIWGFGGTGRDDDATANDPVVFHFSNTGTLIGTALPRKLFGSEPPFEVDPQSGPAFLTSGGDRVVLYTPHTRQLIELALYGKIIGSYVIPLPDQQRQGQSSQRPMGLAGLAITDRDAIYARLNGGETAGLYELDRTDQRWVPLSQSLMEKLRIYSLIGCVGENLVLTPAGPRGPQFPVKQIRVTTRFTP